jgi:hypothetical protein
MMEHVFDNFSFFIGFYSYYNRLMNLLDKYIFYLTILIIKFSTD